MLQHTEIWKKINAIITRGTCCVVIFKAYGGQTIKSSRRVHVNPKWIEAHLGAEMRLQVGFVCPKGDVDGKQELVSQSVLFSEFPCQSPLVKYFAYKVTQFLIHHVYALNVNSTCGCTKSYFP